MIENTDVTRHPLPGCCGLVERAVCCGPSAWEFVRRTSGRWRMR